MDEGYFNTWIWQRAIDDGNEYAGKRDAEAAIFRAFQQYQTAQREAELEHYRTVRDKFVDELHVRWWS